MEIAPFRRYAELIEKKRALNAQMKDLEEEIRNVGEVCETELATNGVVNLPVKVGDKKWTIYTSTAKYAVPKEGVSRTTVVEALEASGLRELVGYHANTLSSWVKDHLGDHEELPKPLADVLEVKDRTSVRCRAGDNT